MFIPNLEASTALVQPGLLRKNTDCNIWIILISVIGSWLQTTLTFRLIRWNITHFAFSLFQSMESLIHWYNITPTKFIQEQISHNCSAIKHVIVAISNKSACGQQRHFHYIQAYSHYIDAVSVSGKVICIPIFLKVRKKSSKMKRVA